MRESIAIQSWRVLWDPVELFWTFFRLRHFSIIVRSSIHLLHFTLILPIFSFSEVLFSRESRCRGSDSDQISPPCAVSQCVSRPWVGRIHAWDGKSASSQGAASKSFSGGIPVIFAHLLSQRRRGSSSSGGRTPSGQEQKG